MSIFDWITGTSSAEKVIGTVSSKLDAAFYTEQEKAEHAATMRDWLLRYMEATAPQNVSRRAIAWIIVALWALLILVATVAQGVGAVEFSAFVFSVLGDHVKEPFLVVLGFYFLAHIVRANAKGKG